MCDHCKKAIFSILLIIFIGTQSLPAASLRWVHLGTMDAGLVSMAIDGKIAYRKMPPGRATPWGNVSSGLHRFQIGSENHPGSTFELEITEKQKITIVSVSDKNGDLQSRTFGVDAPKREIFVHANAPPSICNARSFTIIRLTLCDTPVQPTISESAIQCWSKFTTTG